MIAFSKFDRNGNYNYASIYWQGFILMRMIARPFKAIGMIWISKLIWRRMLMACDHCGALVGMASTISKFGMTCEPCLKKLKENDNE